MRGRRHDQPSAANCCSRVYNRPRAQSVPSGHLGAKLRGTFNAADRDTKLTAETPKRGKRVDGEHRDGAGAATRQVHSQRTVSVKLRDSSSRPPTSCIIK